MKNWQNVVIGADADMRSALERINETGSQMALVADANMRLLGTLSDGDVRRALLNGVGLEQPVTRAMNSTPRTMSVNESRKARVAFMRSLGIHHLPIVDNDGVLVGFESADDYVTADPRPSTVVIMAGGLGSRLRELTQTTPKPMVMVGGRPMLETIVRNLASQGFSNIVLSVSYLADQIHNHFGDGDQFGVNITYVHETQRMGTAGALSLLPSRVEHPILVTNGDVLTRADFGGLLDRHQASGAAATMAVRPYEMQVPFGVINEADGNIQSIEEKPVHRFSVNAGIYVLSPEALDLITEQAYLDMPTLFSRVIDSGMSARSHLIDGYWLDVGRLADYERANRDFPEVFDA